jgi:hypothetical protein
MERTLLKDEFGPVIQEIQHREIQVTKLEVVRAPLHGGAPAFGVPGSMAVLIARAGSGALPELRAALKEGGARLTKLHSRVVEQYGSGHSSSREAAVKAMVQAPVLADIRYGGNTLNSGIFVPQHIDYAIAIFPFNGGRLAAEGFELVEYPKDGAQERLEGIVVEAAPELTEAEQSALSLVPPNQLGRNVGVSLDCCTTWWAVGFVTAGLVGAVALGALGALTVIAVAGLTVVRLGSATHLSEEQIRKLGPAASARDLLALRREALLEAKVG